MGKHLTAEQKAEIRGLAREGILTRAAIAHKYGVAESTVYRTLAEVREPHEPLPAAAAAAFLEAEEDGGGSELARRSLSPVGRGYERAALGIGLLAVVAAGFATLAYRERRAYRRLATGAPATTPPGPGLPG